MAAIKPVQIVGLRDLQRDLRAVDRKMPRELRSINLAAANLVVQRARSTAASVSRMAAAASSAVSAQGQQRNAAVVLRATAKVPFALGAEFGAGHDARRHRRSGTYRGFNQFPIWRGNGADAGYFLYPSIRASEDEIVTLYADRLAELLATAFPN